MNQNIVTRNGKKGFIGPDGKFYEIPQPNTTDTPSKKKDTNLLQQTLNKLNNIYRTYVPEPNRSNEPSVRSGDRTPQTGFGHTTSFNSRGQAVDGKTKPENARTTPPKRTDKDDKITSQNQKDRTTLSPAEFFGTNEYGSGGSKDQPTKEVPIKVDPYKDPSSNTPTPPSTPTPTPTPKNLTPQQRAYGPGSKLTKDQQLANLAYDKKRYELDGKGNPIIGKLRTNPKEQEDAKLFGLGANAAIFPNQKIFVDPKTGKPVRKSSTSKSTKAATGGANYKAGTYAAELQRTKDALSSNFGALSKGTIKPVAERGNTKGMKKEAYDMVLDYLLSEGHVETVEEAHYVMLQMTSEHVQDIVEGVGYSNPSVGGKPVMNPKGHPKAGEPMSFNKAETDGVNEYRKASKKAGKKIYADEPLPKK